MVYFATAAMLGLLSSPVFGRYNLQERGRWSSSDSASWSSTEYSSWLTAEQSSWSGYSSWYSTSSSSSTIEPISTSTIEPITTTTAASSTSLIAPGSTSSTSTTSAVSSTSIVAPTTTSVSSTTVAPSTTSSSVTTTTAVSTSVVAPTTTSVISSTTTTPSTTPPSTTTTTTLATPVSTSITTSVTPTTTTTTTTTSNTATTCSSITYSGTAAPQNTALSFVDGMLDRHNYLRQFHGSTTPMVWSDTLAAAAQVEVNTCVFQHTVNNPYGENLAAMGQTGGFTASQLVVSVDEWYAEIANYDFNNPGYSPATGHFTQVVWLGSTQLGCAWKDCTGTPLGLYFVACEYSPPGNVVNAGFFAANVLPPVSSVSSCAAGTTTNPGRRGIAFMA